jgi:ADP-ribosylglycohydrolase
LSASAGGVKERDVTGLVGSASPRSLSSHERALGALYGAAIGSAVGLPTRFLSPVEIARRFAPLEGFLPRREDDGSVLTAGTVTGDVEFACLMGELLVEGRGTIDPHTFARHLEGWAEKNLSGAARVDRAISDVRARLLAGDEPPAAVRPANSSGCVFGALMVGIATPPDSLAAFVDRVIDVCLLTHDGDVALAGAVALATAVSEVIEGATVGRALSVAEGASTLGAQRGRFVAGASVGERIDWALELVGNSHVERALGLVSTLVGTGSHAQEAIPAAFALALMFAGDPWRACVEAARLGGDSSTIAGAAAAIVGGARGLAGYPSGATRKIDAVNALPLRELARRLIELRGLAKRRVKAAATPSR